jgi:hypothetical protein
MSGVKTTLALVLVLGGFATAAQAQGVVPGGWDAQFGVQSIGNPAMSGGMTFGFGTPGYAGSFGSYGGYGSPFGFGQSPYGPAISPFGYGQGFTPYGSATGRPVYPGGLSATAGTANATDPLIGVIRHSVRSSRRR